MKRWLIQTREEGKRAWVTDYDITYQTKAEAEREAWGMGRYVQCDVRVKRFSIEEEPTEKEEG